MKLLDTNIKGTDAKTDYCMFKLCQEPRVVDNPPAADQVETFWKNIYEYPQPLNVDTPALAQLEAFCRILRQPELNDLGNPITPEEVRGALEGSKNFIAPGTDGLNNYWRKKIPTTHRHLARDLDAGETYTYQGVEQRRSQEVNTVKNSPPAASTSINSDRSSYENYRGRTKLLQLICLPFRSFSTLSE